MPITTAVSTTKPASAKADVLIIPVDSKRSLSNELPAGVRRNLRVLMRKVKFEGEWGTAKLVVAPPRVTASFVGLVGTGDAAGPLYRRAEGLRRGVGNIVQDAREYAAHNVAVLLEGGDDAAQFAVAAYEGVELSNYRFTEHQQKLADEQRARAVRKLILLADRSQAPSVRSSLSDTRIILEGITYTRDLVNQPASHVSPRVLADHARAISKQFPQLSVRVMNAQQAKREGFTAFLSVARGSHQEPYVIHLRYRPKGNAKKSVALVGKGITFDSGGLSIKTAKGMEQMKTDMGGAAMVLGVCSILPKLELDIGVHGIIAACENMPSGEAYRPGDVVTAKNGKTIEIVNTDAEGRVTLADALSYAVDQRPDMVIDLATLTGAVIVALGNTYAGLWSNNDTMRKGLLTAARQVGEGLESFPLPDEYRQLIESKVADVSNVSTTHPMGDAITAALFLREFVGETPWAHIDIAGPVYAEKPLLPYFPYGGTGYGIRTLVRFLRDLDWKSTD